MIVPKYHLNTTDLSISESLQNSPVYITSESNGTCMCNDLRGISNYIYLLSGLPLPSFWRYCVWTNTWQRLPDCPFIVGKGTAMTFDPSRNYVWAFVSNGGTPFWGYYDIANYTWVSRSTQGISNIDRGISVTHTCSTYNASGNDDYFYFAGNLSASFYRYSFINDIWQGMQSHSDNVGDGCYIWWNPGWNTDRILAFTGSSTYTWRYYNITGNSWSGAISWNNASGETIITSFQAGSAAVQRGIATGEVFFTQAGLAQIYRLTYTGATPTNYLRRYISSSWYGQSDVAWYNQATMAISPQGNKMVYVIPNATEAPEVEFIYTIHNFSNKFVRTLITG